MVTIKVSDGDSLLNTTNKMINKCWSTDKNKDKNKITSAQFFFNESGNNLIIQKQCSFKNKNKWNNCNKNWFEIKIYRNFCKSQEVKIQEDRNLI